MSTNKTPHLQLHSWAKNDPVQMSEFNENFAAIDTALSTSLHLVFGSYEGNGAANRTINLGFQPLLVILFGSTENGNMLYDTISYIMADFAMYSRQYCGSTTYLRTCPEGFQITNANYHNLNGYTEHYIAFKT